MSYTAGNADDTSNDIGLFHFFMQYSY